MPEIQWYPGHMAKAKRQLADLIKYLDIILEVRDARLPLASHNNDLETILERRPGLVILNKIDLADPSTTKAWVRWFQAKQQVVVEANGQNGAGIGEIWRLLPKLITSQTKPFLRIGVVGIPNVGKSSVLNRLIGGGSAKTGNMPGITRGKQWVKRNGFEILDTPGLLPPKIVNQEDGVKLALIGTIREEIIPAYDLTVILLEQYSHRLSGWEKANEVLNSAEEKIDWFAKKRGFLGKGGALDINRAVSTLLKEFRDGRFGRISLEIPPSGGSVG